ncbi:MAG TPA: MerR family transcriptional regulator [Candidatus Hypogeohydataceae bacterium YC38]|jgi:DNA-binding transcriptional MerR regulator|nr:MerR family transcriptional regulator [Candidatus Brocadiales bacterium]
MTNFNTQAVCSIIGITPRQVQYWDETGFIKPSVRQATGHGSSRLYSFLDLVQMRVAKALLDGGVSLQKIRKSLQYLRAHAPEVKKPLADIRFLTDGDTVFVLTADREKIMDALKDGQLVFSLALGDLVKELNSKVQRFIIKRETAVGVNGVEYKVDLEANSEGSGFIARCSALNQVCLGETEEQALELIKEAIRKGLSQVKGVAY